MKKLIIGLILFTSVSVHADSIAEALNHVLCEAYETGCLEYAFSLPDYDKTQAKYDKILKSCAANTERYKQMLEKNEK